MTAITAWVRAIVRQRWRVTIVLSLLIGIAGAVAIGAADGARRTQTAFPRMRVETNSGDVLVSVPQTGRNGYYEAIGKLPEVLAAGQLQGIQLGTYRSDGSIDPSGFPGAPVASVDGKFGFTIQRFKILSGRMLDPAQTFEAVADPETMRVFHLHVGSPFRMFLLESPPDRPIAGRPVTFRIVGVGIDLQGVVPATSLSASTHLLFSPAFYRWAHESPARQNYDGEFVRLKSGASLADFERKANELVVKFPETGGGTFIQDYRPLIARQQRSILPLAVALYVFAGLVALASLFVLGQAVGRQQFVEAAEYHTLRALGFTRNQLLTVGLARVALIAVAGALIASGLALAVSPFMPVGAARVAELHPGFEANLAIIVLGAVAVVVLVLARATLPAFRVAHSAAAGANERARRRSLVADAVARSGLSPQASTGVRMAFEQRSGAFSLPIRSALAGSVVGFIALVVAIMFATSLNHLVRTPSQYGWTWSVMADQGFGVIPGRSMDLALAVDPHVQGYAFGNYGGISIAGQDVSAIGIDPKKGGLFPTIIEGRLPVNDGEIAIGTKTMRQFHTAVGRTLDITLDGKERPVRVVARVVLPALGRGGFAPTSLGEGVVLRADLLIKQQFFGDKEFYNFVLVKWRAGTDVASANKKLFDLLTAGGCSAGDCSIQKLISPYDLKVLTQVRGVPIILAAVLALLAFVTLVHALLSSVRLRARDLAILKTIGFVRAQLRSAVAWQTSTLAFVAMLVGLPLGVIAGRAAWALFANGLGVPPSPVVPLLLIGLSVPATLLLANLIGAIPARAAARTEAAVVLRTE